MDRARGLGEVLNDATPGVAVRGGPRGYDVQINPRTRCHVSTLGHDVAQLLRCCNGFVLTQHSVCLLGIDAQRFTCNRSLAANDEERFEAVRGGRTAGFEIELFVAVQRRAVWCRI